MSAGAGSCGPGAPSSSRRRSALGVCLPCGAVTNRSVTTVHICALFCFVRGLAAEVLTRKAWAVAALARAKSLQEQAPEVAAAELLQAELDSLVREYHGGHDQNFDKDALPWSVEQLVSIVRSALYKTAIGQDVMRLVSRWDKDGSGEVTYPQFVMALRTEVKIPKR